MVTQVLLADDQIPDDDIPDDQIQTMLEQSHSDWPPKFRDGFVTMRQVVRTLRDGPRQVTIARTFQEAMNLGREKHFDIAIVDLRWDADTSLSNSAESDSAGWRIAEAIHQAEQTRKAAVPTVVITYSSRFASEPRLSLKAADAGTLPFYKVLVSSDGARQNVEAGWQSLDALVTFFERFVQERQDHPVEVPRRAALNNLEQANNRVAAWNRLGLGSALVSVLLIVAGGILAIIGRTDAGIVSTVGGALTAALPVLVFRPIRNAEASAARTYEALLSTHA